MTQIQQGLVESESLQNDTDENGVPTLLNEKQQMRYARMWLDNGVVNRNSFKNPLQVLAGIQAIKALGLQPMTALRQTGFVNGQFIVYGDIPLAVVRRSGKLEWMQEFVYVVDEKTKKYVERSFENSNLHLPVRGAVCIMKHADESRPYVASYSAEDATLAGLWKKAGPWTSYPHIMLMRKARNVCIQKGFSDVTHCVATEGDVENVPEQNANAALRLKIERLEKERLAFVAKRHAAAQNVNVHEAEPFVDDSEDVEDFQQEIDHSVPEGTQEIDEPLDYDKAAERFEQQKKQDKAEDS